MKSKVFIIVGHSNWGKSETLAKLTSENRRLRHILLFGQNFFVRRMSNDDDAKSLFNFTERVDKIWENFLIMTLCPNFGDEMRQDTLKILNNLQKEFDEILFFILRHSFSDARIITQLEIDQLKEFSNNFFILESEHIESNLRAEQFQLFIQDNVNITN